MWSAIAAILPLAISAIEYFLKKSKAKDDMMALFYRFVEKFAGEYLNSKKLRDHAMGQIAFLEAKPFEETK